MMCNLRPQNSGVEIVGCALEQTRCAWTLKTWEGVREKKKYGDVGPPETF